MQAKVYKIHRANPANYPLGQINHVTLFLAKFQIRALTTAKEGNPSGRWWIKADGCDVRNGLGESLRGVWSGDEDLGDGLSQQLFEVYKSRRASVMCIGTAKRLQKVSLNLTNV